MLIVIVLQSNMSMIFLGQIVPQGIHAINKHLFKYFVRSQGKASLPSTAQLIVQEYFRFSYTIIKWLQEYLLSQKGE